MSKQNNNGNKRYWELTIAALIMLSCSCSYQKTLLIEPISQEFNEKFITLQGLDTSMFSKNDVVQYYQVSDYRGLPGDTLLARLNAFTNVHYKFNNTDLDSVNALNIFFYKKRLFVDYSKNLYTSARDNENKTLEGYSDDLLAWISYQRLKENRQKIIYNRYLFASKEYKALALRDTLSLN
jgi:hypothetical protein